MGLITAVLDVHSRYCEWIIHLASVDGTKQVGQNLVVERWTDIPYRIRSFVLTNECRILKKTEQKRLTVGLQDFNDRFFDT